MYKWFDKKLKGPALFVLLVFGIYAIFYWFATVGAVQNFEDGILLEKRIEIQKGLNRIGDYIALEDKYSVYSRETAWQDDLIMSLMSSYDQEHMTYATVYKGTGKGQENLSARHPSYEGSPFDPFVYPNFRFAIEKERGEIVLPFQPDGGEMRDMYVSWRWTPNPAEHDNPYLLITGISKFTVAVHTADSVIYTAIWGGAGNVIANFILVGYILHIIGRRQKHETN